MDTTWVEEIKDGVRADAPDEHVQHLQTTTGIWWAGTLEPG